MGYGEGRIRLVSLLWFVKLSSLYFLSASLLVKCHCAEAEETECIVLYFELMGWWNLKLHHN